MFGDTMSQSHIEQSFFNEAKTGGQGKGVAKLDETVVVVKFKVGNILVNKFQFMRRTIPFTGHRMNALERKGMRKTDARGIVETFFVEKVVAIQGVTHISHPDLAAYIVQISQNKCRFGVKARMMFSNRPRGLRNMVRMVYPGAWIARFGLLDEVFSLLERWDFHQKQYSIRCR